jgi:hypothetical protein
MLKRFYPGLILFFQRRDAKAMKFGLFQVGVKVRGLGQNTYQFWEK